MILDNNACKKFGHELFKPTYNHEFFQDNLSIEKWTQIKKTEIDTFHYYYVVLNWLNNRDKILIYLQIIILYATDLKQAYYIISDQDDNATMARKSIQFQKWIFYKSCLDDHKWLFLLSHKLIILDSRLSQKLIDYLKTFNDKKIFLKNLKSYIWREHYNRFINLLIKQQVLIDKEYKPVLFTTSFIVPQSGIHQLQEDVIGYKVLKSEFLEPLIAQVIIPAKSTIVVPYDTEKLRCDCYKINIMMDKKGHTRQRKGWGPIKNQLYYKGELVSIDNLNTNLNENCVPGLHFYASFDEAIQSEYVK